MRRHLQSERGFGLVELLIAMTVLQIAVFALVAALSSGHIALIRASKTTTAAALASAQLEPYRALRYSEIRLHATAVTATDTTYRDDTACKPVSTSPDCVTSLTLLTGECSGVPAHCNPSRTATGADGRTYRVDTYIFTKTPGSSPDVGRPLKEVVVVVREASGRVLARQVSAFEELFG